MEKLLVARPWNVDHRSGDSRQCGGRTPVTDDSEYRRVELITGRRKRRNWSDEEKIEILAASNEVGANISEVTRRFGVSRGLVGIWRKTAGLTAAASRSTRNSFVPVVVAHASTPAGEERPPADGRIEIILDDARAVIEGSVA